MVELYSTLSSTFPDFCSIFLLGHYNSYLKEYRFISVYLKGGVQVNIVLVAE